MRYIFHELTPIKEFEPGWFKLRWKPIKNGTWNIAFRRSRNERYYFRVGKCGSHNGWGRSWDGWDIDISLFGFYFLFWIHYNHECLREGPFDCTGTDGKSIYPLDFTNSKLN